MIPKPLPPVRLNDFKALWREHGERVLEAVRRVGESGWYVLGDEVRGFERELAPHFGAHSIVSCASGLDALEIALRSVGVERGDVVLTTPLTAFATVLAIVRIGAVPAFVDVDERGSIDLDAVEDFLRARPETRALVPVHLYGIPVDLDRLLAIRDSHGVAIVEDCAQSIGATFRGRPTGSASRAAATSFYPTKNLGALGDGGAVIANDEDVDAFARRCRDYGQSAKYVHSMLGENSRLDELQAAILRDAMLPALAAHTARRRAIGALYERGLRDSAVTPIVAGEGALSSHHLFPVLVDAGRDAFMRHLKDRGIESGIHYPTLATEQPALAGAAFVVHGELARATRFARTEVSLPIHPTLDDPDVERVIEAVRAWRG